MPISGVGSPERRRIILPLLKPALLVALIFRTRDAFRVFDLVYVMTGGGPGTATEPIALYTFTSLLQNLRFGYGSALSVLVFLVAFVEMLLRLNQVIYAPLYALFIVGPTAMLIEIWLESRRSVEAGAVA